MALRAAGEDLGYPQLAQLLRRLAPADAIAAQQQELFRRLVFNILVDNTDDHEKNHALLRQGDGRYLLSPAFDMVPAAHQRLLVEVDELQAEASGVRASPTGTLRIDMPIVIGRRVVMPLLARLVREHPELSLDVRLQDGYVDLVKEGIDVAIRVGELSNSTLVSRRLGSQAMVLVASPAYLAERGTPRRLEQLEAHDALVFRMPSSGKDRPWRFRRKGADVELRPASRVRVNDGEGLVQAALLGQGLAQLPDDFVREEIARGGLVEVLPGLRPAPIPIHVVYPGARLVPQRVRVLLDALLAMRL